jgi:hypothetical protein
MIYTSCIHLPDQRETYRRLIERAQELGAWVGPIGDTYTQIDPADCPDRSHRRAIPE